eukprot:TRINITY_DN8598_c0_g1_i1.p1 TRINITY_DN8598_c0_g1~~TRINITY_DN8598_c0_g1_i1.p1  ORF type:complete len:255 (-),score=43.16 TRINITY_DN8598_c0_g1_i1:434-1198(-)
MKRSVECPQCRKKVAEVKKNATLNNLIEKYLDKHPDMKRPQEEIEELEKTNKITVDVVEVTNKSSVQPTGANIPSLFSSSHFLDGGRVFNGGGFLGSNLATFAVANPQSLENGKLPLQPVVSYNLDNELSESYSGQEMEELDEAEEENAEEEKAEEEKAVVSALLPSCTSCLQKSAVSSNQTQKCASCDKFFCLLCVSKGAITRLQSKAPLTMNVGCLNKNIIEQQHLTRYIHGNGLTFTQVYENLLNDLVAKK